VYTDPGTPNASERTPLNPDRSPLETTRRAFLGRAAHKAVYAAPIVVVLGMNAEARANSKDGVSWSQCGSQGEPCDGGACCPGFMCVANPITMVDMCQPDNCQPTGGTCQTTSDCCSGLTCTAMTCL